MVKYIPGRFLRIPYEVLLAMVPRKNNIWSCVLQYATRNNAVLCLTPDKKHTQPLSGRPRLTPAAEGVHSPARLGWKQNPTGRRLQRKVRASAGYIVAARILLLSLCAGDHGEKDSSIVRENSEVYRVGVCVYRRP